MIIKPQIAQKSLLVLLTGHALGVLAAWTVQVGIEMYRFFSSIFKASEEEADAADVKEQVSILGKKIYGATVRCSSSLIFASVGAGIGATLIRPSTGVWIGMDKYALALVKLI